MKDKLHELLRWIDHNRWSVGLPILLVLIVLVAGLGVSGCDSQTSSLVNPERTVDRAGLAREAAEMESALAAERAQLDAAIVAHNAHVAQVEKQIELAGADLDRQDAIKVQLLTLGAQTLQTAAPGYPWQAILPVAGALFGVGLGIGPRIDNRRKDGVIDQLKPSGAAGSGWAGDAPLPA